MKNIYLRQIFTILLVAILLTSSTFAQAVGKVAKTSSQNGSFENQLRRTITIKGRPIDRFSIKDRMAHYNVPGVSLAVIEGCKIVETRGYGITRTKGSTISPDTLFQAASISKPVTALAALRLVEQGKFSLDEDVRALLKTWQLPDSPLLKNHPVTLRRLLSHSAGLNVGGFGGFEAGTPLPTVNQILDGQLPAKNDPVRVRTVPGTQWRYSGGGFVIAQLLMTEATGKPFPQIMRDLVLAPAGMTDSGYTQPLPKKLEKRAASGHYPTGSVVPGNWHIYPELGPAGLWTTPRDVARFAISIMQSDRGTPGALISRPMAADMLKTQIAQRGLGFIVTGEGKSRSFSHGGTNEGFQAWMVGYPETCQGAIVMANSDNGRPLINEILRAIADSYHWPDPMTSVELEQTALTPAITARFVGTYQSKSRPDWTFDVAPDKKGDLIFWWTGGTGEMRREALLAFPGGLFSPDSGIVLKAPANTNDLTYSVALGTANEAVRVGKQKSPK
jgi:CubicO group peptidase (beta-lactamase class C family)